MSHLGLFGGSFDPPHLAHLIAAECAVEQFSLDRVLFIPAGLPPHKTDRRLASSGDRLAMTELAIQGNDRFAVDPLELERPGPSYTIDTLLQLRKRYQPESLTLIIGADMLAIFPSWHRSEEILGLARVAVLPRPGTTAAMIPEGLSDRVTALKMPLIEISSTMIRERIQHGRSTRYLVPDAVGAYIKQHRLYTEVGDEALSNGHTTTQTA